MCAGQIKEDLLKFELRPLQLHLQRTELSVIETGEKGPYVFACFYVAYYYFINEG